MVPPSSGTTDTCADHRKAQPRVLLTNGSARVSRLLTNGTARNARGAGRVEGRRFAPGRGSPQRSGASRRVASEVWRFASGLVMGGFCVFYALGRPLLRPVSAVARRLVRWLLPGVVRALASP